MAFASRGHPCPDSPRRPLAARGQRARRGQALEDNAAAPGTFRPGSPPGCSAEFGRAPAARGTVPDRRAGDMSDLRERAARSRTCRAEPDAPAAEVRSAGARAARSSGSARERATSWFPNNRGLADRSDARHYAAVPTPDWLALKMRGLDLSWLLGRATSRTPAALLRALRSVPRVSAGRTSRYRLRRALGATGATASGPSPAREPRCLPSSI
jgi:hypothetical protein